MRFVNHELQVLRIYNNNYFFIYLKIIQNFTQIDIKSIEELGNGVVYCKLFDRIYPGTGIMKKIKLNANKEWEN